jgi:hypothetical protein
MAVQVDPNVYYINERSWHQVSMRSYLKTEIFGWVQDILNVKLSGYVTLSVKNNGFNKFARIKVRQSKSYIDTRYFQVDLYNNTIVMTNDYEIERINYERYFYKFNRTGKFEINRKNLTEHQYTKYYKFIQPKVMELVNEAKIPLINSPDIYHRIIKRLCDENCKLSNRKNPFLNFPESIIKIFSMLY